MTKREKLIEDVFIAEGELTKAEEEIRKARINYRKAEHNLQKYI